jgi:DMSO/TMAO reductase YedYZ molybdopterin-dependent catalytic subunit
MKKPGPLMGALIGCLLTVPLIAVLHLGWRLVGLPFAPFNIFDWVTRILPGPAITAGIESMVKVIRALNFGSTADVAKGAEQATAIVIFLCAGIVAGAVLFAVIRIRERSSRLLGTAYGAVIGAVVILISSSIHQANLLHPLIGGLWTLAAFASWGAAGGWAHRRLSLTRATAGAAAGAPPAGAEQSRARQLVRLDRRRFLVRLGAASATITVTGALVDALAGGGREVEDAKGELWSDRSPLPNADAAVIPAPGTRPELTPLEKHYRIDINTTPPVINQADWRLRVGGLVEEPLEMGLDEIRGYEPMHQFITLSCISNPVGGDLIGTTRWTGTSLRRVLPVFKLKPGATHLKISAADGFYEVLDLETIEDDERVMLAYAWDGVPLEIKHGFPLRIYIPDVHGMKQPKWIETIEAIDHWEAGYWVARGWDRVAQMKATSVIDTIAMRAEFSDASGAGFVPVGGIAHAGARGISRVEVQVDGGQWRQALLRTPLSGLTWVIWRYDMPFQEGAHTLTVRCYDGNGTPQIATPSPSHPSGATGLYSKTATL